LPAIKGLTALLALLFLVWTIANLYISGEHNSASIAVGGSIFTSIIPYYPAMLHLALAVVLQHGVANNHYTITASTTAALLVMFIADLHVGAWYLNNVLKDSSTYQNGRAALCDIPAPSADIFSNLCKLAKAGGAFDIIWLIGSFGIVVLGGINAVKLKAQSGRTSESATVGMGLMAVFSIGSLIGEVIVLIAFYNMQDIKLGTDGNSPYPIPSWNSHLDQSFHLLAASVAMVVALDVSPLTNGSDVLKRQVVFALSTFTAFSFWGFFIFRGWQSTSDESAFCDSDVAGKKFCEAAKAYVAGYGVIAITQTLIALIASPSLATDSPKPGETAAGSGQQPLISAA